MRKAFTLIELSIVLIIVGILFGGGASMMTQFTKQQQFQKNMQKLERLKTSIEGFVLTHKRLPNQDEKDTLLLDTKDHFGKPIEYVFSAIENICNTTKTSLKLYEEDDEVENVLFVLVSRGKNRVLQTTIEKDKVVTYPYMSKGKNDIVDDIALYLTLYEMKVFMGCKG